MRTCGKCGTAHGGVRKTCKPCEAIAARTWRANNRQKARDIVNRYQERHPEVMTRNCRVQSLKRNYGISIADYEHLFRLQRGQCAVCGTDKPIGPGKRLTVDHDHKTGTVRGLVCCNCNFVLGHCRDNPAVLRAAANYLERR